MADPKPSISPHVTPDGRYFVVRGRLWRATNPNLSDDERERLVKDLMTARRAVKSAKGDAERLRKARSDVDVAKVLLGERGPVWWTDGSPDFNRKMVKNMPYRGWYKAISKDEPPP